MTELSSTPVPNASNLFDEIKARALKLTPVLWALLGAVIGINAGKFISKETLTVPAGEQVGVMVTGPATLEAFEGRVVIDAKTYFVQGIAAQGSR